MASRVSPAFLFRRCFRLGLVAFGGPAAHIALLDEEFVERRRLLDRRAFLDLVAAANLIPGPNSTETVMHLGYRLGGWAGLLLAGAGFILPAAALTLAVAMAYTAGQSLEGLEPVLTGIQAGVLAIIAQAVWKLAGKGAPDTPRRLLGLAAGAAAWFGAPEALVILGAGLLWSLRGRLALLAPLPLWIPAAGGTAGTPTLGGIAAVFLKTGAVLFGSGYVLVAYLEADLVDRLGWLSRAELLDAIAMGQFTPGPVLTTATFVGYQLQGLAGAAVATAAIFAPSFVFVAATAPFVARLRAWPPAAAFLDGANAAAVGVMAAVLLRLLLGLPGAGPAVLALAAGALVFARPGTSPVLVVLGSALLGGLAGPFLPGF